MKIKHFLPFIFLLLNINQALATIGSIRVLESDNKIVVLLGDMHAFSYLLGYYNTYLEFLSPEDQLKLEDMAIDYLILDFEQSINIIKALKLINKNDIELIVESRFNNLTNNKKTINLYEKQFDKLSKDKLRKYLQESIFPKSTRSILFQLLYPIDTFSVMMILEILAQNAGIKTTNVDFRTSKLGKHYFLTNKLNLILDEIKEYQDKNETLTQLYTKAYETYVNLLFTKPESEETRDAFDRLIDVRTVYKIMNGNKKIYIVVEGEYHTSNISKILENNFKLKDLGKSDIPENYEIVVQDSEENINFKSFQQLNTEQEEALNDANENILIFQKIFPDIQKYFSGKFIYETMLKSLQPYVKPKSKL